MGEVQREKLLSSLDQRLLEDEVKYRSCKALNGEVISGDSMQIYRTMDIGTAKVTKEEMDGIPHYMVDIKDPEDSFSVAEFQERVRKNIRDYRAW